MKVTVLGSSGLVGYNLKEFFIKSKYTENWEIDWLTSKEIDLLSFGQFDDYLGKNEPEVVVNLAGKVGGILANKNAKADFYFENIIMNANVYHLCAQHKIKHLVNLGAGCGYPVDAPEPLLESSIFDGLPQPESIGYSMAKKMLLIQEEIYRDQYELMSTVIIPSNLYGANDNFSLTEAHVIPALVRKFYEAKIGESSEVLVWGDGSTSRDFVSATDIASVICIIIERGLNGVYNVGFGNQTTVKELTKILSELTGVKSIKFDTSMPSGQKSRQFSMEKFKVEVPDYKPIDLIDGLRETLNWYEKNSNNGIIRK